MKTRKEKMIRIMLAAVLLMAFSSDASARKQKSSPEPDPIVISQPVAPAPDPADSKEPVPPAPEPPVVEYPTPDASSPTGKLRAEVTKSGLYRITAAEIASTLGTTVSETVSAINSDQVRVSSMGSEIAWLKANDSVYFYGEEIGGMYGGNNVYWIELGVSGTQMSTLKARAPRNPAPGGVFMDTQRFEEDHIAAPNLFYSENSEFWFWDYLYNPYGNIEKTLTFNATGLASVAGSAQLRVALQGGYNSAAAIDNHVRAYVNGTLVGEAQWAGENAEILSATFSQALLNADANELRLVGELTAGAPLTLTYIDSFEVTYARTYEAANGSLKLAGGANSVVSVNGFTAADIMILDISNPTHPQINGGIKVESTASGQMASFQPLSATTPYLAVSLLAAAAPVALTVHADTELANADNAAAYVVITPASLADAAAELAAYRQAQGLSAKVVTVEEIYDEFNGGLRDPLAIQAFLAHAVSQWAEAPRYVVLAGQGSYDYNNVMGNGDCLVPPMMVYTPTGLVVSDSRFADVDNDGAPDLAIGRLPVMTEEALRATIDKIRNYEIGGTWKDTVQMIADNDDSGGYFTSDAETVASMIPSDRTVQKAYLTQQSLANVRTAMLDSIASGRGIVNYIGHGLMAKLASEGILTQNDVASLTSFTAPVVLTMACDVGRFGNPGYDAISETLVAKANGGAVAVWAASGLAYSAESRIMNIGFYEAMSSGSTRLGDAVNGGLTKYRNEGHMAFMRYVYNLMGDPATVLSNSTSL